MMDKWKARKQTVSHGGYLSDETSGEMPAVLSITRERSICMDYDEIVEIAIDVLIEKGLQQQHTLKR